MRTRTRTVLAAVATAGLAVSAAGVAVASSRGQAERDRQATGEAHSASERGSCPDRGPELPGPYELPQGSEPVDLEPQYFTTHIDNPYWPMVPGTVWEYRETTAEGEAENVTVTVTEDTRTIEGIEARVVHDVVRDVDGAIIEDTYDWYAQDCGGSIWYLGEDTTEYTDGGVSTAGSWEYGVDGAQAGIIVPAEPQQGWAYRQEYDDGNAEDNGEVLSLEDMVEVPYGYFDDVLTTRATTPLEPRVDEHKFYARGVGPALTVQVSGGLSRNVLLDVTHG